MTIPSTLQQCLYECSPSGLLGVDPIMRCDRDFLTCWVVLTAEGISLDSSHLISSTSHVSCQDAATVDKVIFEIAT